jgi:hypothetical protein
MQKKSHCKTCPWIRSSFGQCFDPNVLERTIVKEMMDGRVQYCHHNQNVFCAGALSYQKRNDDFNTMARVGIAMEVIDYAKIDESFNTFESVVEMLTSHSLRSNIQIKINHE